MFGSKRRSGFSLVLAGAVGIVFFMETEPRSRFGHWIGSVSVDIANQAWIGTVVGLGGSVITLLIGVWLLTRRMV
jgi:uncharacterized membrane protein